MIRELDRSDWTAWDAEDPSERVARALWAHNRPWPNVRWNIVITAAEMAGYPPRPSAPLPAFATASLSGPEEPDPQEGP